VIEEWPDRKDKKRNSLANVIFAVNLLAREASIRIAFDVCLNAIVSDNLPETGEWLSAVTRLGCSCVSADTLRQAVEALAQATPVDPWRDAMLALPMWDGTPRLDTLFTDVFGAFPSEGQTFAARAAFAGLVMRQVWPGAPAPVVPVLIGPQGWDKGQFIAQAAEALKLPAPVELTFSDDRKMSMQAARAPLCELCEMAGLGRRDAEDVKSWITNTQDVYRRPYERNEEDHPRRFVLIGTANKWELNRDETGNRRMMPVLVQHPAAPGWAVEMPQIVAEAKARFCEDRKVYLRLIREAAEAVREFNREAMANGQGMPVSDLDDLLPPLLERQLRDAERPRVQSAMIRTALDAQVTGRRFSAHEIARWLKSRGWEPGTDGKGMRYYIAPQIFLDKLETFAKVVSNPFTGVAA
jgi:predicted P-loop ATPase